MIENTPADINTLDTDVLLRTAAIVANAAANPPVLAEPATSTFQINNTKL